MRVLSKTVPALALLLLPACSSAPASGTVASSQASLASPPPASAPAAEVEAAAPPRGPIPDGALVEGPSSRDPFRAFKPVEPPPPPDTRPRKAHRIPLDQLKLVALVTHTATPRAMLVDPSGKGYVVTQGELVGRPEPDGDHFASFRVDRIRDGDVVLVREGASDPRAPASTRVLALPREPLLQAED
jgi:type IV pilus assembly protein PilP